MLSDFSDYNYIYIHKKMMNPRKIKGEISNFLRMLVWSFRMARGERKEILFVTFCGMVEVFCGLAFVWASKNVIDIASKSTDGDLIYGIIILITVIIVQISFNAISQWVDGNMPIRLVNMIRHKLFTGILVSKWNEMEKFHTGDILNRITQDASEIVRFISGVIPFFVVTAFQLVASFIYFLYLDATLGWILALCIPLFLVFSKLYVAKMRRYSKEIRESESRIHSVIQESARHRIVLKTFERIPAILGKLSHEQDALRARIKSKTKVSLFSNTLLSLGFNGGYLLVFIWGLIKMDSAAITFGTMTAFLQLVNRLQRPAYDLTRIIPSFISAWTAYDRIVELQDLENESESHSVFVNGRVGVRAENLSFKYEDKQRTVIDSVSFDFLPGTVNAIIGETGAGKTTLLRLILALVEPSSGSIKIYNNDSEHDITTSTRSNFVYVPQGNTLFSGTIRDNMLLGNPDATEDEMRKVLSIASADFVFELDNKMDTVLGEGGVGLSEGQAQRIAVARSLLRPGSVLLFDEATSALDRETEKKMIDNLKQNCVDKTMIFITHHRELAGICDNTVEVVRNI